MGRFIVRRLAGMVPFIFLVSITVFALIKLTPGDFVSNYAAALAASGETVDDAMLAGMRVRYGLDQSLLVQYWRWIFRILHGDFGYSFLWQQPVVSLIGERMGLTLVLSVATLLFTWAVALPIGVYSAVKRYSVGDYIFTLLGFIGLAVPGFLLALVLMYVGITVFHSDVGGLFFTTLDAPWSWDRVVDLARHMWIPMIILGTSGAASLIRIMRANLLDQLHQPYVDTARAKGLSEFTLLVRYPIRIALNPFVSTLGWVLPHLVSGSVIISIVLNLPTAGPLLLQALLGQDQYLAGAFLLLLCSLTVLGTLLSDILLALLDPRYQVPVSGLALAERPELATASEARLTWLRFRRHKLAMFGLVVTVLLYLIALFAEFVAPFDPDKSNARLVFHPPQAIHFIDIEADGWHIRPFATAYRLARDPVTLQPRYVPDANRKIYLSFLAPGDPYKLWTLFPGNRHLISPAKIGESVFLLGADRQGRDVLSRIIHGARASLSIGLVGVSISLLLGIVFGGLSGYFGGRVDWFVQRAIEFIISLPTIPIWLALAAALPKDWPPMVIYFTITLIISLIGWTELARVVRGRFLALRSESFVTAAWLDGCSGKRIIFRHMLPSLTSHIIASVTLAIPLMILAETALSFLGLGLQPPAISWGALLKEAQNVQSIAAAPWLLLPGAAVAITVLALNFLGDGLRDAADPHGH